jgi:hypothetical protein
MLEREYNRPLRLEKSLSLIFGSPSACMRSVGLESTCDE